MKNIKTFSLILFSLIAIFISQKIFLFKDYSPTIIIENNKFQNIRNKDLYQNDKIIGEFTAKHNNLGIISVNFNTHWNINTDYLQFRIKEKDQNNWYYINKYKVDQFQNNQYFPFGFPEISNSKGKIYQIEIESLYGTPTNSVTPNQKPFLSKYSFSRNYLLQNKNQVVPFLCNKFESFFRHINFSEYIFIIIFTTFIFLFLKSKNGKKILQFLKNKNITTKNESPIFYWYFWSLGLIILISFVIIFLKKHYESSEWLIYELSTIISFFAILKFNIFNKKIKSNTIKKTLLLGIIILISQLIFFTFYLKIISWRYLLIAGLSIVPSIIYYHNSIEKFLKIFLVNLLLLFCISGFFIIDIDSYSFINFIILLIFILIISFFSLKIKFLSKPPVIKTICFLIVTLFIIFSIKKPINYHHYSYYIGPAYEISQHKSILSQVPSQYGYLSVHFVKNILSPFGINFVNFNQLNTSLFTIFFIFICLIIFKIIKNAGVATIFSITAIGFTTMFSMYKTFLYPSSGPLRFGFGIIIILLILYLKNNKKILIATILVSITCFWSIETATYIVPAWIFTLTCQNYINNQKIKPFLLKTLKQIGILFGLIFIIFAIIFTYEWNHIKTFPDILNYLQFANAFKDGYGSELIPKFGNYYITIAILLLGLTLSIFTTINKVKNNLTIILNFLSIHNIAIFSYFIGRSHENNILNISVFLFIELIISFKLIESIFFKKNKEKLFKMIIFPFVLFIVFFGTRCIDNYIHPEKLNYSHQQDLFFIKNYELISQKYGLYPNNVLIISKDYSTSIISEFKIKTILPLNPCTMTTLLPNYQEKYLIPNLSKISIGTTLVYTNDMPELMEFFEKNFTLKPIIKTESNELFDLYTFENKITYPNGVK